MLARSLHECSRRMLRDRFRGSFVVVHCGSVGRQGMTEDGFSCGFVRASRQGGFKRPKQPTPYLNLPHQLRLNRQHIYFAFRRHRLFNHILFRDRVTRWVEFLSGHRLSLFLLCQTGPPGANSTFALAFAYFWNAGVFSLSSARAGRLEERKRTHRPVPLK